jgi:hypothetical protein
MAGPRCCSACMDCCLSPIGMRPIISPSPSGWSAIIHELRRWPMSSPPVHHSISGSMVKKAGGMPTLPVIIIIIIWTSPTRVNPGLASLTDLPITFLPPSSVLQLGLTCHLSMIFRQPLGVQHLRSLRGIAGRLLSPTSGLRSSQGPWPRCRSSTSSFYSTYKPTATATTILCKWKTDPASQTWLRNIGFSHLRVCTVPISCASVGFPHCAYRVYLSHLSTPLGRPTNPGLPSTYSPCQDTQILADLRHRYLDRLFRHL